MVEKWKDYVHPDDKTGKIYQVSNLGRVISINKEGEEYEHTSYKNNGYRCIPYTKKNGKNSLIYLHKIVASLHVDNPNGYKHVVFIGRTDDCSAENLRWVSREELRRINSERSSLKAVPNKPKAPAAKHNEAFIAIMKKRILLNQQNKKTSWTRLAKQFGITYHHLYQIREGRMWKHVEPAK